MSAVQPGARMDGSHVVITGANSGIGKQTAIAAGRLGAHVTLACRDPERGEAARREVCEQSGRDDVALLGLDLASLASVRSAAAELLARDHPIDVLVNNAGVAVFGRRRETADGFERQFGVNHLGHFLLTALLRERIVASAPARVVVVSSAAYGLVPEGLHWDDLMFETAYDGWKAYGQSKLANLLFTWELARRLEGTEVSANALHPGFVDTDLGHRRPEERSGRPATAPTPSRDSNPAEQNPAEQNPAGQNPAEHSPGARISSGSTTIDLTALGPARSADEGAHASVLLASAPELAGVTGAYFDEHGTRTELPAFATDGVAARRLWALSHHLTGGGEP